MMLRNLLLLLLCLPLRLPAQSVGYNFVRFDTKRGLSHNQVNCFLKDRQGFLWIGTQAGINRFDGYSFRVYRNELSDTSSLPNDYVDDLMEDPQGKIWVSTRRNFSVFDPKTERFYKNADFWARQYGLPDAHLTKFLKSRSGNYWINHLRMGLCKYEVKQGRLTVVRAVPQKVSVWGGEQIADFQEDSKGRLWIIYRNGLFELLDPDSGTILFSSDHLRSLNGGEPVEFNLFVDSDDDVWLYSDDLKGGQYFDARLRAFSPFNTTSAKFRIGNDIIRAITQDEEGKIWVATDHGGISLIDKRNNRTDHLVNDPDDEHSLSQNCAISIYRDSTGAVWVGTFKKGFNLYHKSVFKFPLYRHRPSDPYSLPADDANDFVEDARGNLWIGTNGGGLIYFDRKTGRFSQYRHVPGNPNSLSNDVIVSLCIDHEQKLWIGTYFGGLNCFDGKTFTHFMHDPGDSNSLPDDRVWEIFEDSRQNLWVGTLRGGLSLFDPNRRTFRHFTSREANSVHSDYISTLAEDRQGNLWIGTDRGIDVFDQQTRTFLHYENHPNLSNSLSNNVITSILEDKNGNIWIGTLHGLNLFDKKTRAFQAFGKKDELPDDVIVSLVEDNSGGLWMGTPNGLANATPFLRKDGRGMGIAVRNYNELDGLQSREFNEKAACKTRQGELVFGGANGFNIFSPENIDRNPGVTKVLLTDFQISDHSLRPGEPVSDRVVLERSMTETCALTLEHGQNVFSLGFAALNFFHPEKNVYQYTLEGFNQGWYTADNKTRKVTYTNLDPGNYVFRVRVADETGAWVESKGLKICVQPPFWRSTLAYVVYFLLIAGALFLARWIMLDRERMNFRIEQERLEAQRTHELDLLKIKFLTNISHEFRTPLSLIMTPIERLMHAAKEPGERVQLALVFRNAKRLLNQVNQLLDFKKLEVAEARFVPAQSDLVSFVREISHSFSEMSGQKHIDLSFNSRIDSLQMIFDQEKMSRVMYNLLSNAFKFTPEHGRVSVTLERPPVAGSSEYAEIRVSDTGIGIPRAAQRKIFDRFYQHTLPDSVVHQGSGIGLSITREFVKLHEGTIRVESEEHKGSTFIIRLPVRRNPDSEEVQEMPGEAVAGETAASVAEKKTAAREGEKKYSILIVEDDADFRAYLKNTLREQYEMLEAPDGKSAWNIVLEQTPDLVVSDVMMPVMDGIELCRRIKADRRISHIPVILLTARTAEEQQLLGYETGADAYITKPFQFDILSVRIHNLIRQKEQLRRKMQRFVDVEPSEIKIDSLDEQLVRKAIDLVEQNIANADFSVEELSHALAMSRVYLYKKLLALTGKTPIEFIRVMRLKRAAQLLEKSQLTVAEVAYKVGFNNPKYFAKYFKEEYGMLPTAYQKKTRNAG